MPDRTHPDEDRRRRPRFRCGGQAQINCLPSTGIILPGTIRDLSLHGCCVDSLLPIDCGTRAEIVVRVSAASFRAMGEVRAIRGQSGAGVEFVHISAGGKDILEGLLMDLARSQALMNKLKSDRREMDEDLFRKELEDGSLQAAMSSKRFPFLRTILTAVNAGEEKTESTGEGVSVEERLLVSVNLFG